MSTSCRGHTIVAFLGTLAFACSEADSGPPSSGSGGASTSAGGAGLSGGVTSSVAGAGASSGGTSSVAGAGASSGGTSSVAGGRPSGGASTGGAPNGGAGVSGAGTANAGAPGGGSDASSGCTKTGAATGVLNDRQIEVGGAQRTYVLSVPTDYQAERPYPLVFAWHGLGGSGTLARAYFRIEQQGKGQALFVYPDGLPNDQGQPGWDLAANGGDVALFDALTREIGASYCVDASRVFSTGHSFGGFFTERLACSRGAVLRGIAPVAGGPPFGGMTNCTTGVAAWIAHGSNDETVDFETGEAGRDLWLQANGCGATTAMTAPEPCVAYEGCQKPVHWCVHEDGHDWPSFAGAGIWSFFSAL